MAAPESSRLRDEPARSARLDQRAEVHGIAARREHDRRRVEIAALDADVEAGHVRELDVEEHDVGAEAAQRREAGCAVHGLADDREPVRLENRACRGAKARVVVDDEHSVRHGSIVADHAGGAQYGEPHTSARRGGARRAAQCEARGQLDRELRHTPAMTTTSETTVARPNPRRARPLRERRRLDAEARRLARRRRARHRRRRPHVPRLRRRHRLPEHRPPLRAGRRRDQGAGRRVPPPVLHGRRLRAVRRRLPPARRALAVRRASSRSRSSSTRAPRRTRTPSRSRARRPGGPRSSSSTTRSTVGRC